MYCVLCRYRVDGEWMVKVGVRSGSLDVMRIGMGGIELERGKGFPGFPGFPGSDGNHPMRAPNAGVLCPALEPSIQSSG